MESSGSYQVPPLPETPDGKGPRGVFEIREVIKKYSRVLQYLFKVLDDGTKLKDGGIEDPGAGGDAKSDEKKMQERQKLLKRVEKADPEAVFPVYGVVKSSKSTLLSYIMRESLLPSEAMPMTSIPIKVVHKKSSELKDGKSLTIPFHERWNEAVQSFQSKLIAGTVDFKFDDKAGDAKMLRLKDIAETIKEGKAPQFNAKTTGDDKIRSQLYFLSHFVRLLWAAGLDMEEDFKIEVEADKLPQIEMSMLTFEHFDAQRFSFMDTPGYNELGATEVLEKLAPKMVSTCSGCIAVIPWREVDGAQMEYFYDHLIRTMKNKTIIVIASFWDSFGGNKKEKQAIVDSIKTRLKGFDVPMFFTSAKKLEIVWRIQAAIDKADEKAQPWVGLKKRIEEDSNMWPKWIELYYEGIYNDWAKISEQKLYEKFVGENGLLRKATVEYQGEEIARCIEGLYLNSAKIALKGYLGSLDAVFEEFQEAVEELRKFAKAGVEERKKIQNRLEELKTVYEAVSTCVRDVPKKTIKNVEKEIDNTLEALVKWASAQDTWHIRQYKEEGGKKVWLPYKQYIQFESLPRLNIWFESHAKPTLLKPLRAQLKETISKLPEQLGKIVQSGWVEFDTLVEKLKKLGDEVLPDFLAQNVGKKPEIKLPDGAEKRLDFNKKALPYKYGTVNGSGTSFSEDTNLATIVFDNEELKQTILKEFKSRTSAIVTSVTAEMTNNLREFSRMLEEKVDVHLQTLNEIYERNKKLLEDKLDVSRIAELVKAIEVGENACETFGEQISDGLDALGSDNVAPNSGSDPNEGPGADSKRRPDSADDGPAPEGSDADDQDNEQDDMSDSKRRSDSADEELGKDSDVDDSNEL